MAHAFGLSPTALALAVVYSQAFVTATIIGATSIDQLREDIDGSLAVIPDAALVAIAEIQRAYPDPCP